MTFKKAHQRIRWRVRRCPDGWLPRVLVGEVPLTLACQSSKHAAKCTARNKAAELRAQFEGE